MAPEISIIILNYNGKDYLIPCIQSVLEQEGSFEILLVDNNSDDGSVEIVRRKFKHIIGSKILIIENETNTGFAEGNNIGVKNARGKYIVLLNNDTIVKKGWLNGLISPLQKRADVGTVGSLAYSPETEERNKKIVFNEKKAIAMTVCQEVTFSEQTPEERRTRIHKIFYAGGASIAFRKKEFPAPFDKNYFAYAEDTYLGWLSKLRGKENVLNTRSQLIHYGSKTKRKNSRINKISVFNGTKNQIMNHLIFYEWKNVIRVLPLFMITQIAHVIQNPRKFIVKLKAYYWIIMNWNRIMGKRNKIQSQRKVPDEEIIRKMSCQFLSEDSPFVKNSIQRVIIRMLNKMFCAYCFVAGIRTYEFN